MVLPKNVLCLHFVSGLRVEIVDGFRMLNSKLFLNIKTCVVEMQQLQLNGKHN